MSRPISITSAVTFTPSSYNSSMQSGSISASTSGTYSVSNGLNGSGNTASYAQFTGTTQNSDGYAYYDFNVTGIPQNAVINSVSCVARGRASSNNRGTTGYQLFAGTTGKGSEITFTSNSASAYTLSVGSWTATELQSAKLRIRLRRTSTNTFASRFYGATLFVNYTFNGTAYTINTTSTYAGATVSPATQEVMNGESAVVQIYPDDLNNITVEDNGTDVTDQLEPVLGGTGSTSGVLGTFDSTNSVYNNIYNSYSETNAEGNGSTANTSTYRSSFVCAAGEGSEIYIYYDFQQISGIPQNATITNVSCQASVAAGYSGHGFSTKTVQLCSGTTPKGTASEIVNEGSTAAVITVDGGSSWTLQELSNVKILMYGVRNDVTSNPPDTGCSMNIWGVDIVVEYALGSGYSYTISNISADHTIVVSNAQTVHMKANGNWSTITRAYKKTGSGWVEQTDLTNLFQDGTIYVNGN